MPFDSHQSEPDQSQASEANADAVSTKVVLSELELALPDDLQHLAEQLGEDALHLSALYPPRATQKWHASALQAAVESQAEVPAEAARKSPMRWIKPMLVAASLLVAVSLAWQAVPKSSAPEFTPAVPVHAASKPTSEATSDDSPELLSEENTIAFHPAADQPATSSRVIGSVQTEQTMVPAGLFITLSGPEQEAMLDLIEDAKIQQPSVSF